MFSKLLSVEPRDNYKLYLEYQDGVSGEIDFSSKLHIPRYQLFKDKQYFNRAHIENNAIVRDERMDMCGDKAYIDLT